MYFTVGRIVSLGVAQHCIDQRYIRGHTVGSIIPSTSCTVLSSHLQISFFSLRGFEYLAVWDDLSAVGVVLLAAYIRHLVREQLFFSPLPIQSQPTCMSTAVYCCLISHLGEGVIWIIFTRSVVPATVFSQKNVHNFLIDGKRYCLLPCPVAARHFRLYFLTLPPQRLAVWFAKLCKKTRWSPCACIVLLWLCFHSLCSSKDWICTQLSTHVISCFPQMWAQQNNTCDPGVWIPW